MVLWSYPAVSQRKKLISQKTRNTSVFRRRQLERRLTKLPPLRNRFWNLHFNFELFWYSLVITVPVLAQYKEKKGNLSVVNIKLSSNSREGEGSPTLWAAVGFLCSVEQLGVLAGGCVTARAATFHLRSWNIFFLPPSSSLELPDVWKSMLQDTRHLGCCSFQANASHPVVYTHPIGTISQTMKQPIPQLCWVGGRNHCHHQWGAGYAIVVKDASYSSYLVLLLPFP